MFHVPHVQRASFGTSQLMYINNAMVHKKVYSKKLLLSRLWTGMPQQDARYISTTVVLR
jgi:hypothetical protein